MFLFDEAFLKKEVACDDCDGHGVVCEHDDEKMLSEEEEEGGGGKKENGRSEEEEKEEAVYDNDEKLLVWKYFDVCFAEMS